MFRLLKRNIYYCNSNVKSIAYKTLVRPLLEYGSTIWDPHFDTDIKITAVNPALLQS